MIAGGLALLASLFKEVHHRKLTVLVVFGGARSEGCSRGPTAFLSLRSKAFATPVSALGCSEFPQVL